MFTMTSISLYMKISQPSPSSHLFPYQVLIIVNPDQGKKSSKDMSFSMSWKKYVCGCEKTSAFQLILTFRS